MALKNDIPALLNHIQSNAKYWADNHALIDIYEGNLKPYVENDLRQQLSAQAFSQAKFRISPINVLQRIVDKLSKIYQEDPTRRVEDGSDTDSELLEFYDSAYRTNTTMNCSNEFFNMSKASLLEPYVHKGKPKLRVIPNDRFLPWSNDEVDPQNPTHIIVSHGQETYFEGAEKRHRKLFRVYTDDEFIIFDSDGNVRTDKMGDNTDGVNPYGRIPFVYVNRSKNLLVPKLDTDMLTMTLLIPVAISDINFATMMQCFSIIYTIDADVEGMKKSPNAVWHLKTDADGVKPEIGTVDPSVDSDKALTLIQAEFSLWLNTKGIKPGSIGKLTTDNFASGISKMIDEMDTSEDRKKQVSFYADAEEDLWSLTKTMHDYWVSTNQIDTMPLFSVDAKVVTDFQEQLPTLTRGDIVEDLELEVNSGFTSRRRAIQKLNPKMTEEEIDELIAEIDAEKSANIVVSVPDDEPIENEPEVDDE